MKRIYNEKQVNDVIERKAKDFIDHIKSIFFVNSKELVTHIRERHLKGGTTATKLNSRTGELSRNTQAMTPRYRRGRWMAGVVFKKIYAGIHIGEKGTRTTIRPKKSKYLTIPLDSAKTASGELRKPARQWQDTFFKKSKKGNLILFQNKGAGEIDPLFVLKKKVRVKHRIDANDLVVWAKNRIIRDLKKEALA